jgi:hypothetical protein
MADEDTAAETVTTTESATTEAQPVKTFTQADLDRVAAKARQEGEQRALKKAKEQVQVQPSQSDDSEKLTMRELKARLDESDARREYAELVVDFKLPKDARDLHYAAFRAAKPADPAAWVASTAKLFATGEAVAQPANQQATAESVKPIAAAATTAPNKIDPANSGGLVNIFALSPDQIESMPLQELRGHFEKILDYARGQTGFPARRTPQQRK